jgi:O-antigen/teichoic acid export membrane protein
MANIRGHAFAANKHLLQTPMSVARKILWNTLSQVAGKIVIAIIGIITVKMLTTYLGKTGYGQYTTAYEFLAFFSIVADLGLYTIGVREMAKDEKKTEMIVGNILTIRTILSIIMVIIAGFAAFLLPKYQGTLIPLGVIIAGVAMVLNILTATVTTVLQVRLKMEYNSFASVLGKIATVIYMGAIIYFVYPGNANMGSGFYQLIWAGVLGNAIMLWGTFYYSSKYARIRYRFTKSFYKDVLLKALPYGLALILNTVYFRIGSVLLSLIKGPADVGIYGVPMRMLEAVGIIPLYFMNAVFPVLTRSLDNKDGKHQTIIQYAFDFLVMGSMPIVAGTVVLAYPIVYLVSTPEFMSNLSVGFYGSDIALQILIFALAFSFINSLFGFILVAVNQQTKLLARNAFGALLTVILDLLLIPHFGVRGAAFSNVVTEFYIALASYLIAKRFVKFKINLKNTFKITLSAVVMALSIFMLRDITYKFLQNKNLFILLPIGCAIYVGMLFLTRTITPDMLAMIKKPKTSVSPIESGENFENL